MLKQLANFLTEEQGPILIGYFLNFTTVIITFTTVQVQWTMPRVRVIIQVQCAVTLGAPPLALFNFIGHVNPMSMNIFCFKYLLIIIGKRFLSGYLVKGWLFNHAKGLDS